MGRGHYESGLGFACLAWVSARSRNNRGARGHSRGRGQRVGQRLQRAEAGLVPGPSVPGPEYLAGHQPQLASRHCVRFDQHAIDRGTPGANENCPASGVGRNVGAIVVQPGSASARAVSRENPVSHVTAASPRIQITASYGKGSAPFASAGVSGTIDVFWKGGNGSPPALWHAWLNPGKSWAGPQNLGGADTDAPPVRARQGRQRARGVRLCGARADWSNCPEPGRVLPRWRCRDATAGRGPGRRRNGAAHSGCPGPAAMRPRPVARRPRRRARRRGA